MNELEIIPEDIQPSARDQLTKPQVWRQFAYCRSANTADHHHLVGMGPMEGVDHRLGGAEPHPTMVMTGHCAGRGVALDGDEEHGVTGGCGARRHLSR